MRLWIAALVINGGDATQAAVTVGYKAGSSARKAGQRFSTSTRVQELQAVDLARMGIEPEGVLAHLILDIQFNPEKEFGQRRSAEADAIFRRALLQKVCAISKLRSGGLGAPALKDPERVALLNLMRARVFEGCFHEQRALGVALLEWAVPEWRALAPDLVGTALEADRGSLM